MLTLAFSALLAAAAPADTFAHDEQCLATTYAVMRAATNSGDANTVRNASTAVYYYAGKAWARIAASPQLKAKYEADVRALGDNPMATARAQIMGCATEVGSVGAAFYVP